MKMELEKFVRPKRQRLASCTRSINYPLILLFCRIVLSISQLSVALYTWSVFRGLSKLSGKDHDLSLSTVMKANVNWVPTMENPTGLYGTNKYFNLFMVRLFHYFYGKTADFLLYPSVLVFVLMMLLSIYDVFQWYKSSLDRSYLSKVGITIKSVAYFGASAVVILEFILVLFYSDNLCQTEMLHPFLFGDGNELLLNTGSCKMGKRFVLSIILTSASLVPDTFLLILGILPTFRTFAIIHGLKFFCAVVILGFVIVIVDVKGYISVAQSPDMLDHGISEVAGIPRYKSAISPINRYSDMISARVSKTLTLAKPMSLEERVIGIFKMGDAEVQANMRLSYFIFTKSLYIQTLQTVKSFIYSGTYVWAVSFLDAVAGLFLLIKRQKFFVPVLGFVNFISWIAQVFHIIMVQFPIYNSKFFCDINGYTPSTEHLSFETTTICSLLCETSTLFKTHRGVVSLLAILSFISIINLGIIYK